MASKVQPVDSNENSYTADNPLPVSFGAGSLTVGAVEIRDGAADIRQTVLPASTAAGATDKAAVVGLSPNSPLPAGTNAIGSAKDNGPSWTSAWGVSGAPVASSDMSSAANVTDAPTSGQKICIDDIFLTNRTTGALECTLKEETSGNTRMGPIQVPANSTIQLTPRGKLKHAVADKKFTATWSASGNVNVLIGYHSEA